MSQILLVKDVKPIVKYQIYAFTGIFALKIISLFFLVDKSVKIQENEEILPITKVKTVSEKTEIITNERDWVIDLILTFNNAKHIFVLILYLINHLKVK